MSSSSEDESMPLEAYIEGLAAEGVSGIIPEKSKLIYEKCYKKFCEWLEQYKITEITDKVMLAFFTEKSKSYQPSTMWSEYSKLKCTIYLYRAVDISKFPLLISFLKRKSVGHVGRKSNVLRFDDFCSFISKANDNEYLMMKVAMIIGIGGACRREELTKLTTDDVTDSGSYIVVNITDTKTYHPRQFVITEGSVRDCNLLCIVRKYVSLRKPGLSHNRFFLGYRGGKCIVQPVGINTVGGIPKKIATFLNKPDPAKFTGHCFRRSSATLLAEAGASLSVLMRHAGWKSPGIAEMYVEQSVANKCKIAKQILGDNTNYQNVVSTQEITFVKKTVSSTSTNVAPTGQESVTEPFTVSPSVAVPQQNIASTIEAVPLQSVVVASSSVNVLSQPVEMPAELLGIAERLVDGTDSSSSITKSIFHGCTFKFNVGK